MTLSSQSHTLFRNARIVLKNEIIHGSLEVKNGVITAIDEGASSAPSAIDCEGDYLIAGLIELHTDHLEQHFVPRPKVHWNPLAAVQAHDAQIASSGITTVFDALRVGSDGDAKKLGAEMRTLADAIANGVANNRLRADHLIHLRCELSSSDVVSDFEPFLGHPLLKLASLMDHTPGQRQFVSLEKWATYYQGKTGMSDVALAQFMDERMAAQVQYAEPHRRAIVQLCKQAGIALASHDDAIAAHVDEAIKDGVSIAEFPTTLEAAKASHEAGLSVLMGAPNVVRGGSHSGNVSALDLANNGHLDILSSDYVPFSLLQAAFMLPKESQAITLPQALCMVTHNPAKAAKLDDRGRLEVGLRADLVRVQLDEGEDLPLVRSVWRQGTRVC